MQVMIWKWRGTSSATGKVAFVMKGGTTYKRT